MAAFFVLARPQTASGRRRPPRDAARRRLRSPAPPRDLIPGRRLPATGPRPRSPGPAATSAPSSRAPDRRRWARVGLWWSPPTWRRTRAGADTARTAWPRAMRSDAVRATRRCRRDARPPCALEPSAAWTRCNPIARPCIHIRMPHSSDARRGAAVTQEDRRGRLRAAHSARRYAASRMVRRRGRRFAPAAARIVVNALRRKGRQAA